MPCGLRSVNCLRICLLPPHLGIKKLLPELNTQPFANLKIMQNMQKNLSLIHMKIYDVLCLGAGPILGDRAENSRQGKPYY